MCETLLVGSTVIKLMLLIWLKNLNKSESKRYFCNSRKQNNKVKKISTIYTSNLQSKKFLVGVRLVLIFLTVVDNMPPAVTVESVRYLVYMYVCFKILFLANIG